MLPSAARLWPTPAAGIFNDSESPESWHERAEALKEKGINGNGAGLPLAIQAREGAWMTPNALGGTGYMSGASRNTWRPTLDLQARGYRPVLRQGKPNGPAIRPDPTTETAGAPISHGTPTSRLQLNTRFVEALMGLPPGWTDCEGSATPSCQTRPPLPCDCSGTAHSGSDPCR
jgi:hypothetical protein